MKEIRLTNSNLTALVDDEDYAGLVRFNWQLNGGSGAVQRCVRIAGKIVTLYMSRQILGEAVGLVDHEDHNKRNNQKYNLRPASRSQNGGNRLKQTATTSSKFKGVYVYRDGRITAQIVVNRVRVHLGYFKTEQVAAEHYDTAARSCFGAFAKTNFEELCK